jgi:hypothetical protein
MRCVEFLGVHMPPSLKCVRSVVLSMFCTIYSASASASAAANAPMGDQGAGRAPNHAPEFRVRFSEWLAVYDFVNNLSANVPQSPFKKLFADSAFNQDRYKALLAASTSGRSNTPTSFPSTRMARRLADRPNRCSSAV